MAKSLPRRVGALIAVYAVAVQAILSVVPAIPAMAGVWAVTCAGNGLIPDAPAGNSHECCVAAGCGTLAGTLAESLGTPAPQVLAYPVIRAAIAFEAPAEWPNERPRHSRAPPPEL